MKFYRINKTSIGTRSPYADVFFLVKQEIMSLGGGKIVEESAQNGTITAAARYLLSPYDIGVKFTSTMDSNIQIDFEVDFPSAAFDPFESVQKKIDELIDGVVKGEWIIPPAPPPGEPVMVAAPPARPSQPLQPKASGFQNVQLEGGAQDVRPSPTVSEGAASPSLPQPQTSQAVPGMRALSASRKSPAWPKVAIGCVAITILVLAYFRNEIKQIMTISSCQDEIRKVLKDPQSATFSNSNYWVWEGTEIVNSVSWTTRAANSFGAYATQTLTCNYDKSGGFVSVSK